MGGHQHMLTPMTRIKPLDLDFESLNHEIPPEVRFSINPTDRAEPIKPR